MDILHNIDVAHTGGIQELILNFHKHDRLNHHAIWAAEGSMSPIIRSAGMVSWAGGPPAEAHYDVLVGHGVGGWSYNETFKWAKERGMKTIEAMHSNCKSLTSPELVDGFVALNSIAAGLNSHMPNVRVIYGLCDVRRFYLGACHYVGRLSRLADEKEPLKFVELARSLPEANFIIAGNGPLYQQVVNTAPTNLKVVGQIRDFESFYSNLRLFVFPTRDECCCMSVAMAQAAGVPVICQDIAPLRETTGGFARFCSSAAQFREEVLLFLLHSGPYNEMAREGRAWAEKKFSPAVVVAEWDKLIRAI